MAEVEPSPGEESESTAPPGRDELEYRLEQQRILAEFGITALRGEDVGAMLDTAVRLCAKGMRTSLAKLLEHRPAPDRLLVRAGVGWKPGVVGRVEMGADLESPAGFSFKTGEAVISNHLENEERFRTPAFMAEHGVRRAINVLIEVAGERYGVLEVDSRDEGSFEEGDLSFMQGFANLIGVSIERAQALNQLQDAMAHQELLTREASHRVKNSLTMVSAMLQLQAQEQEDEGVIRALNDAQARITTIAQAHDQLWRSDRIGSVDLSDLLCTLAERLGEQSPKHPISCSVDRMTVPADQAIPLGLLSTELVTNAAKYAYDDGGPISIDGHVADGKLVLTVSDAGRGLPPGFDMGAAGRRSLGMRMISSLVRQLRATISFEDAQPGTRVRLELPDPR